MIPNVQRSEGALDGEGLQVCKVLFGGDRVFGSTMFKRLLGGDNVLGSTMFKLPSQGILGLFMWPYGCQF